MVIKKAVVRSFDATTYEATMQLAGSDKAYLENVVVARNILSGEVTTGRGAAVLFFDENMAADAVVIAVYL